MIIGLIQKIMETIREAATEGGAQVMIASDFGLGLCNWMRDWYRALSGDRTKMFCSIFMFDSIFGKRQKPASTVVSGSGAVW